MRLSLVAALGALVLSIAAPDPTRAAPTPGPTLAQPPPARAPSATPSPATPPPMTPPPATSARPSPAPGLALTPAPNPAQTSASSIAVTPSPAPLRAPAIAASPSPVQTTPPPTPSVSDVLPASDGSPAPNDSPLDPPADEGADIVDAPVDWQAFVPTDVADHLATMDRAARDSGCGVPWHLLAAIARVESDFGRNMATSSAGAMGYGQFLPSSWQSFGNDGNVYDYRDALPAIATYLCQSGLERDPRAALYAYNHADWYVDLVLGLAVRFDRMAPGAPTPDVLGIAPATESGLRMHYAAGRDVRRATRRRTDAGQADWLGIPWHGRPPGAPISAATLEGTTLAMLGEAFGLPTDPPRPTDAPSEGLTDYADRAWTAGLLGVPIQPPVVLPFPDERRPEQNARWSIAEIRRNLERGQPVLAILATRLLPGHVSGEAVQDQPLVLIGTTPAGLVYSDPSFSSSLGYGLELSDPEFLAAWQAASSPAQALAFSLRPRPLVQEAHSDSVEPPPVSALMLPTPPPQPRATEPPATEPPAVQAALPLEVAADAFPTPAATREVTHVAPEAAEQQSAAPSPAEHDRSWAGLSAAGAALIAAALAGWRVRARR